MNWGDQLTRIRRYLRDPDGNIWSDSLLLRLYNNAQKDMQIEVGQLEDIQVFRVPSLYQESYLYDWEWRHTDNTAGYVFQALNFLDQQDMVYVANWEAEQITSTGATTNDSGWYFTQPWEAFMDGVTSPGNPPPVWASSEFDKAISVYYNRDPLEAYTKKQISIDDRTWKHRTGKEMGYYRSDTLDNEILLYPKPSTVSWTDFDYGPPIRAFSYSQSWEEAYMTGTGNGFTIADDTDEVTYNWETNYKADPGDFEYTDATTDTWIDIRATSEYGIAIFDEDGDTQDLGLVVDGGYVEGLTGASTDILDWENNLLMVFTKVPTDIVLKSDISDFPKYLRKYIEYSVLEEAYAANTDGKIQSLEDYWNWRKKLAYKAIKTFSIKKRADRDYRLVTKGVPARAVRRHPRLPDTYPVQYL